jgi:hypothetical protein
VVRRDSMADHRKATDPEGIVGRRTGEPVGGSVRDPGELGVTGG